MPTTSADAGPLAIDAKHLAPMLCVSVRTIRTMDSAGKLPKPVRLNGRAVRWIVSEIAAWLRADCPDRGAWEAVRQNRKARK